MLMATLLMMVTTAWILCGTWALFRARRVGTESLHASLTPITVLKPLCGADPDLERNLRSFFRQDHPCFELVFGVADSGDPALAVVERLAAQHPAVEVCVVVQPGDAARNPKIGNLLGMAKAARHDAWLISDSNVEAPPSYLTEVARELADPAVGLVTHLFAGVGESTLGAALENVQINGFVAAGTTLPTVMGTAAVVGKSMAFRKGDLQELGGLESVAHVLAEDYVLGKMFQHAGYEVVVGRTVLRCVNGRQSLRRFFDRQLRWGMLRIRLAPIAHVLEPLASPLLMLPVATVALGVGRALLWCAALLAVRDLGGWLLLRGRDRWWVPVLLGGLRDLTMLAAWLAAPFVKYVTWRGTRVRIGAGTMVFAKPAALCRVD